MRFYIIILMLVWITFSLGLFAQDSEDLVSKKNEGNLHSISGENSPEKKTNAHNADQGSQAQIRQSRKLETSLGVGYDNDKLNVLKIQYNLTSNLSIGYSQFHRQEVLKNQWSAFGQLPYPDSYYMHYVNLDKSRELGLLNIRYYLFEKIPLYVTGGFGRDFIGIKKTRVNPL